MRQVRLPDVVFGDFRAHVFTDGRYSEAVSAKTSQAGVAPGPSLLILHFTLTHGDHHALTH